MMPRLLAWISAFRGRGVQGTIAVFLAVAGLAAILASLAVGHVAFLTSADRYVKDWEVASLTPAAAQDPDIIIAAITEQTLSKFPYRSPVDRQFVNDLLRALAAKHPRAIGVDLLFDQPTEAAKDDALKTTIKDLPVPLIIGYTDSPGVVDDNQLAYLDGFVPPDRRAYVNLATDQTDTARWIFPGQKTKSGKYLLSFPRAIAAVAGVTSPDEQVQIIWHGRPHAANTPTFVEYPAQTLMLLPESWIKGKIVLIGSDLTLVDRHRTPFAVVPGEQGMMPGIVIQAHALSQLIHRTPSPYPGWFADFLIALACALVGAGLGAFELHLLPRAGIGIVFLALLWLGGGLLFIYGDLLIGLIAPTIAAAAAFAGMDSLAGLEARRKREFIQGAMSRYLPRKYVEALVQDPARMSLEGERREMTFLFTDVKDFTTMSEGLDSKALTPLLNAYLEGMTQIVHQHDGMVDKFIGDAVFAIFNPPVIDLPDHAERAVRCALAMDRFCENFRKEQNGKGIPLGLTRIGVNTGTAAIGNFGSAEKFTYTAQGDAVNTASRLEGLNKHLGTRICVSNATRERCKNIRFRPIASVVLKGKTSAVEVWEPIGEDDERNGFLERYREAFEKLEKESPEALDLFLALDEELPGDPCVNLHVERLRHGEKGAAILMTEK